MRIIPVMDLKRGRVVHAVAGRRAQYRPIRSRLAGSSHPEAVARAFRNRLGLTELYVADLDAIGGAEPSWTTYEMLRELGLRLIVDAGVASLERCEAVHRSAGAGGVVVGLESIARRDALARLVREMRSQPIWFSLDLRGGTPIAAREGWSGATPEAIARDVVELGITRLIVLDLERVGMRGGSSTTALCQNLLRAHPGIELVTGGGIRDRADLQALGNAGVAGALVATALHERRLP
jgi:HisA/HisF family protein